MLALGMVELELVVSGRKRRRMRRGVVIGEDEDGNGGEDCDDDDMESILYRSHSIKLKRQIGRMRRRCQGLADSNIALFADGGEQFQRRSVQARGH